MNTQNHQFSHRARKLNRRTARLRTVGYASFPLLLLCAFALINPSMTEVSFAEEPSDINVPVSTEVGVNTATVISLAVDDKVDLNITPVSTGTTSYGSSKLVVNTNSNNGYSLYLQGGNSDASLVSVAEETMKEGGKITSSIKTNSALGELEANSYGYALSSEAASDATKYSGIPTDGQPVMRVDSSSAGTGEYAYSDTYNLTFGTRVDTTLPAGQYAGTVTISAVANPKTLTSLYDLTYMQQMQPEICANTRTEYTKQLTDARDGKKYWVTKLKDGKLFSIFSPSGGR